MATTDSMRISSKSDQALPYSEIIGIKAYNAKAAAASHSQDSVAQSSDLQLQAYSRMDSLKEESESSGSVGVFDPPDTAAVVMWSLIIGAVIISIICFFINRKSNP